MRNRILFISLGAICLLIIYSIVYSLGSKYSCINKSETSVVNFNASPSQVIWKDKFVFDECITLNESKMIVNTFTFSVDIIAFVELAAIKFTQLVSNFVNMTQAYSRMIVATIKQMSNVNIPPVRFRIVTT